MADQSIRLHGGEGGERDRAERQQYIDLRAWSGEDVTRWLRQQKPRQIREYADAPAWAACAVTGADLFALNFSTLSRAEFRPRGAKGALAPVGPLLLRVKKLVARQRPADTQFADGEAIRSVDGAPRLLVHSLLGRGSFSEVYRVRWDAVGRRQGRMFALKVVKAARLAREHAHDLDAELEESVVACLLYTSPSPRDRTRSRMPSSA